MHSHRNRRPNRWLPPAIATLAILGVAALAPATLIASEPGCFPAQQTAFSGPFNKPSTLPTGDWHVMANGRIYTLSISSVSGSRVTAELSSGDVVDATWDASSKRLTFVRELPTLRQEFTGYLLQYDGADSKRRLAGVFGDVNVGPQAGWYATLP